MKTKRKRCAVVCFRWLCIVDVDVVVLLVSLSRRVFSTIKIGDLFSIGCQFNRMRIILVIELKWNMAREEAVQREREKHQFITFYFITFFSFCWAVPLTKWMFQNEIAHRCRHHQQVNVCRTRCFLRRVGWFVWSRGTRTKFKSIAFKLSNLIVWQKLFSCCCCRMATPLRRSRFACFISMTRTTSSDDKQAGNNMTMASANDDDDNNNGVEQQQQHQQHRQHRKKHICLGT